MAWVATVTPQDVGAAIFVVVVNFGVVAALVLRASAFVRRGAVRSGWGRRWITVRSPEDLVIVAVPPFRASRICVKVNESERTLLVCAPSLFAPRSPSHKVDVEAVRNRIVEHLKFIAPAACSAS